ncbi:MAG: thymidine phosphorylase, partial [Acidobacteria bacterium]|nr:thymidine phosphorylase [Acidobacteriota bacterium]
MNFVSLIHAKRDGGRLTDDEIQWLIAEYSADRIPDYQMASMLMAVFLNGLDPDELTAWTDAMLRSGDVLDFSHVAAPKIDKHSTGGVGDKVSIPLVPIVASCGIAVPMISGRGLGHTGGTLDKLEAIPGFRTALDPPEFSKILERYGMVMAGQSETLVPADRRLYALRDASGTVPSIPLISSSIMSKKLAEGLDGLVLDVKVGSGAFMKDLVQARQLAKIMVGIGSSHGTTVTALITNMSQPLGREVGNASEIRESIDVLHGRGPPDLVELTFRLGAEMLVLGGVAQDLAAGRAQMETVIASGEAFEKFKEVVAAQDGDTSVLDDPRLLPRARNQHIITAERSGVVIEANALDIGVGVARLGAGRETKDDVIDPAVGTTV